MDLASSIPIQPEDIPSWLRQVIEQLPGFAPETDGWEEPDLEVYPAAGAVFVGTVSEIEISVAKLRSGSVQISFSFYTESVDEDETDVVCGAAWLFPSVLHPEGDEGHAQYDCAFRAYGYLHAILANELFLSVIRLSDELSEGFLFGSPQQFMSGEAHQSRMVDGSVVLPGEEELDGKDFIRAFTCLVGAAQPYMVG